jgi:hypothetical protein
MAPHDRGSRLDPDRVETLSTAVRTAFLVGVRGLGLLLLGAGVALLAGTGSDPTGALLATGGFTSAIRPRWTLWFAELGRSVATGVAGGLA